jgi:glycosyltransferase involved in cell wall biosynthesis
MRLITIVVPTLNEEKSIGKVIDEIPKEKLKADGYKTEIIVVDSNSTDKTREVAKNKGVKVVIERRMGYGRAYKTGFKKARGDIIVTADGDFTYPLYVIPKLIKILEEEKLDFISTNRFMNIGKNTMSFFHKIGNIILNKVFRFLFGKGIKDSQSGMWVFKKNILKNLNLKSDGMAFSEEIKIEVLKRGLKFKEVPIKYRHRIGTKKVKTFEDGLKNFIYLFVKRLEL